ncbi:expressed unknown protein [Seminavis robusta]|uniref:Uncharacterized protein n=1 Tax=Seminavis robusta TaxID=568900 RepID=A0A9N8E9D5_9STRA|nr:expressed unknown protein [Seminavis robusta]|eukprot:Sro769_g199800.1 n/a (353) ;mRNA; r:24595-25653
MQGWTRLMQLNHFHPYDYKADVAQRARANYFGSLYKHIDRCWTEDAKRIPTLVSMDMIGKGGNAENVVSVFNDGGVILHKGRNCPSAETLGAFHSLRAGERRENPVWSFNIPNDQIQSMVFVGPMKRGVRIELSSDPNAFAQHSQFLVTLIRDIKRGDRICVPQIEESKNTNDWVGRFRRHEGDNDNYLEYQVSRIRLEVPSSNLNDFYSKVMRGLQWTPRFNSKTHYHGLSKNLAGPMIGMRCLGKRCDSKFILQADTASPCHGWHDNWVSKWFSEEHRDQMRCPSGQFMRRLQCREKYCDDMRIYCFKPNNSCKVGGSQTSHFWIDESGSGGRCSPGAVITGIQCHGDLL